MSTQDDNKTTADLKKEPKSALKDKPGKFSNQEPFRRFDLLLQNIPFFGYWPISKFSICQWSAINAVAKQLRITEFDSLV